jgi:hypothetical protein
MVAVAERLFTFVEEPKVEWSGNRPFAYSRLSDEYAKILEDLALQKEAEICALPIAEGWENDAAANPTTARFRSYSAFLLSPVTLSLFIAIHQTYHYLLNEMKQQSSPRFIQCWYNIHRSGHAIPRHSHAYPFIGVFSANAEGSLTRYGETKKDSDTDVFVEHHPGQVFITTGPGHYHSASSWKDSSRARVTYAFDIVNYDQWNPNQIFLPFDM